MRAGCAQGRIRPAGRHRVGLLRGRRVSARGRGAAAAVSSAARRETELAGTLTSCSLIALSAVLTTLGWYQKLAARAGAGSLVPITGFANAVVSAAIEFKAEGRVLGTGAKMFTIAGPVIVYGTLAAVVEAANRLKGAEFIFTLPLEEEEEHDK